MSYLLERNERRVAVYERHKYEILIPDVQVVLKQINTKVIK